MVLKKQYNFSATYLCSIFFLGFLLAVLKANAQGDFIITLKNDTIKGTIKTGLLSKYVFESNDGEKINISSDKINGYYLSDKKEKFVVNTLPDPKNKKRYFFQVLEEGRINLYQHEERTPEGVRIITWYVSKLGGGWKDIFTDRLFSKIKPREIIFNDLISDNEDLAKSYQSEKKYNLAVKRKYISTYNNQLF